MNVLQILFGSIFGVYIYDPGERTQKTDAAHLFNVSRADTLIALLIFLIENCIPLIMHLKS